MTECRSSHGDFRLSKDLKPLAKAGWMMANGAHFTELFWSSVMLTAEEVEKI
jgi:hypothetical protein